MINNYNKQKIFLTNLLVFKNPEAKPVYNDLYNEARELSKNTLEAKASSNLGIEIKNSNLKLDNQLRVESKIEEGSSFTATLQKMLLENKLAKTERQALALARDIAASWTMIQKKSLNVLPVDTEIVIKNVSGGIDVSINLPQKGILALLRKSILNKDLIKAWEIHSESKENNPKVGLYEAYRVLNLIDPKDAVYREFAWNDEQRLSHINILADEGKIAAEYKGMDINKFRDIKKNAKDSGVLNDSINKAIQEIANEGVQADYIKNPTNPELSQLEIDGPLAVYWFFASKKIAREHPEKIEESTIISTGPIIEGSQSIEPLAEDPEKAKAREKIIEQTVAFVLDLHNQYRHLKLADPNPFQNATEVNGKIEVPFKVEAGILNISDVLYANYSPALLNKAGISIAELSDFLNKADIDGKVRAKFNVDLESVKLPERESSEFELADLKRKYGEFCDMKINEDGSLQIIYKLDSRRVTIIPGVNVKKGSERMTEELDRRLATIKDCKISLSDKLGSKETAVMVIESLIKTGKDPEENLTKLIESFSNPKGINLLSLDLSKGLYSLNLERNGVNLTFRQLSSKQNIFIDPASPKVQQRSTYGLVNENGTIELDAWHKFLTLEDCVNFANKHFAESIANRSE